MNEYVLERRASWFKKWSPRRLEPEALPLPLQAKPTSEPSRYQFQRVLSRGGDGLLWLVHDTAASPSPLGGPGGGEPVLVMKRRSFETLEQANEALHEAFIMSSFQSSCCLRLLDVIVLPALSTSASAQSEAGWVLGMIFPYMAGGDLCDALYAATRGPMAPFAAIGPGPPGEGVLLDRQKVARDILQGLADIHAAGIIHGDMKLENILLDERGRCKICDFGVAVRGPHCFGRRGSTAYMAPEMVSPRSTVGGVSCTAAIDIWACGVILLQLCTGTAIMPLETKTLAERVLADGSSAVEAELATIEPEHKDVFGPLVTSMLALAPAERPSAKQCLAMIRRWVKGSSPRTPTESPRQNQIE
jgi:serine/threonine protein kinase